MPKQCMRCFVSGRVQGVWFRASTKEEADKLEIKGWVRNLSDGRVEVLACGDVEQLEQFYEWLQQGPPLAEVNDHIREFVSWEECISFEIV